MSDDGLGPRPLDAGGWSLDLRTWAFAWSAEAREIHGAPADYRPTVWEALAYLDPPDIPRVLALAEACLRTRSPFELDVTLLTLAGVRKPARLVGWLGAVDRGFPPRTLEGVIFQMGPAGAPGPTPHAIREPGDVESLRGDAMQIARWLPHELGAPLAIAEAFSAALQEREAANLSPRGRVQLARVQAAAVQARQLSTGLLHLANISTQLTREEPVDLTRLAQRTVDLLRAAEPERDVQVDIEAGLRAVGDPDLLALVIGNLLSNAWKYTSRQPSAHIAFTGSLACTPTIFRVTDNGVGFPAAAASQLFLPFTRLQSRHEFPGIGIGLSVARRAVDRMGGRIWAEGEEGRGASFFFTVGDATPSR